MARKIIHIDCDCFYASVEMRDNPSLRGRPVAVGGSAKGRGVLATCNYEARQFGLHSAMPTAIALRKCPDLILVRPRFDVYKQVSAQIRAIFLRYTELIEPLSLDEAYLDVSQVSSFKGSATLIAEDIRQHIEAETGITASAGVAPNKFLAKIASDWRKPNGIYVIRPQDVEGFVASLSVNKIPGVGAASMKKMDALNIRTCADLAMQSEAVLIKHFGKFGRRLASLAVGGDTREVVAHRTRKSLGVERTFHQDVTALSQAQEKLPDLLAEFHRRFARIQKDYRIRNMGVKLKTSDFMLHTMETRSSEVTLELATQLLQHLWDKHGGRVRLLGITAGLDVGNTVTGQQLPLFRSSAGSGPDLFDDQVPLDQDVVQAFDQVSKRDADS
ncbi:DNA polymerase IV [BD1-7 clade bacterium]|uniref:DNA polymerase IV n=1 Tax=BD1-7 clade bacterium TaxID=2029982 RepID=A0A5S9Q8Y1_9GAMM|nr:DNA polymerase IV [BD1-7 clade bacterium]CAA0114260.1 DNA polymerase IV [BD1-7 clade bacterium]